MMSILQDCGKMMSIPQDCVIEVLKVGESGQVNHGSFPVVAIMEDMDILAIATTCSKAQ